MAHGTPGEREASIRVGDIDLEAGGVTLSGLAAVPPGPCRGLVLALHGGGSRAAYWHRPAAPDQSLLLLGAALGWTVLAVDRPGYGASFGIPRERQDLDAQVDVMFALADRLLAGEVPGLPPGGGLFVAAHSMGAILALRMAADARAGRILGVAAAGVPLRYSAEKAARLAAVDTGADIVPPLPEAAPDHYFGPPGTYDPALLTREGRIVAPVPMAEFVDARDNPLTLPGILGKVTPPVQWTVAEHERSSLAGPAALAEAGRLLTSASRVEPHVQRGVGHNISLHHGARAYHLRVMAFAEECLRG
jgi:pimeloyl-ACP methyl ester carboxylesterase